MLRIAAIEGSIRNAVLLLEAAGLTQHFGREVKTARKPDPRRSRKHERAGPASDIEQALAGGEFCKLKPLREDLRCVAPGGYRKGLCRTCKLLLDGLVLKVGHLDPILAPPVGESSTSMRPNRAVSYACGTTRV